LEKFRFCYYLSAKTNGKNQQIHLIRLGIFTYSVFRKRAKNGKTRAPLVFINRTFGEIPPLPENLPPHDRARRRLRHSSDFTHSPKCAFTGHPRYDDSDYVDRRSGPTPERDRAAENARKNGAVIGINSVTAKLGAKRSVSPYYPAVVYAGSKEKDKVLDELEK
jgi:hypothetical protein